MREVKEGNEDKSVVACFLQEGHNWPGDGAAAELQSEESWNHGRRQQTDRQTDSRRRRLTWHKTVP